MQGAPKVTLERIKSPAMPYEAYRVWFDGIVRGSLIKADDGQWSAMRGERWPELTPSYFPDQRQAVLYLVPETKFGCMVEMKR